MDGDVDKLADRWREGVIGGGPDRAALGYEFTLFLPRNPQARVRVAAQREQTARSLAGYIAEHLAQVGGRLRKSEFALARLLIATHEGVTLAGRIDGEELYRSFLQLVMANVEPAADGGGLPGRIRSRGRSIEPVTLRVWPGRRGVVRRTCVAVCRGCRPGRRPGAGLG